MTRSMARWTLAGCMALAALGAVTVLESGSATARAEPSVSPFAGSWSGTWSADQAGLVGTYDWTIADEGRITGTVYGTTSGRSGTVVGHVDDDGDLNLTRYAPNDEPSSGYGAFHFHGTAVIDGDGKLVASLNGVGSNTQTHAAILERN